ncbi:MULTISPECIES: EAL domain-containing protein [Spirulina sp. CCY15215]|uniref:EAL domain-containing protein n=1 Tax=Spirulina sp. CCY15215 TaxID=2767591 RepID=UPI00194E3B76|nr:EAL domain-containing protein [Spirulina major]
MKQFARSQRCKKQEQTEKSSKISIFSAIPIGDRGEYIPSQLNPDCITLSLFPSIIALVENRKILTLFEIKTLQLSTLNQAQEPFMLLILSVFVLAMVILFRKKKNIYLKNLFIKKTKSQEKTSESGEILELRKNLAALTKLNEITLTKLNHRLRYQSAIANLSQLSLKETDFDIFLQKAVNLIAETLELEFVGLFELLGNESSFLLKAGIGWPAKFIGYAKIWISATSLTGYTLKEKNPIVFDDLRIETRFHASPLLHNHKIISGANLLIPQGENCYGMLGTYSNRSRQFTQEDLEFLQTVSQIIAAAVQQQERLIQLNLFKRAIDANSNSISISEAIANDIPLIYVNPSFEKLTGYKAEEIVGQSSFTIYGEQADPEIQQEILHAQLCGLEYHAVIKNYRRDGIPFWSEFHLAPVLDLQGYLTHYITVQTDITDRHQVETALRKSEEQFRLTFELAPIGMFIISLDGDYLQVNQAICNALGYSRRELLHKNQKELTHPDDRQADLAINQKLLLGEIDRFQIEKRFLAKDKHIVCALLQVVLIKDDRAIPSHFLGQLVDISDRKRAEEALHISERRLDGILTSIEDVVWSAILPEDPENGTEGILLIYLNQAAETIYGRPVSEFFQNPNLWFEIVHLEDRARVKRQVQVLMSTGSAQIEYRILRPQGDLRWLHCRSRLVHDEDGKPSRIDGISSDITDRKQAEEKLHHSAFYDSLTDLPNRASFIDRLWHTMRRANRRGGYLFAVLFLDLDWFKVINDSLGHSLGDRLLIQLSRRLESCLRPSDTLARLGGDEFTILLEELQDPQAAIEITEMILDSLRSPFDLDGHEVFTNTSIGVAFSRVQCREKETSSCSAIIYDRPEDFLRDADTAMYRAKALGKGRYAIFDSNMHASALARLELETHLRRSLERQELFVCYQPIISLKTGKLTGFEALIRWQHPEKGLISPVKFIPIAEETGEIVAIGAWILREATRQLQLWHEQFPYYSSLTMNINLSGKQIRESDFIKTIDQTLVQTGLKGTSLKLEITESVLMDNVDAATQMLLALRDRDIQLCIDDFGTGYSSLSYLHRFPVNTLKIDRSFVKRMKPNGTNLEIVQAIVSLSRALGMDVVAEGIETEAQLIQLKDLGCEFGQGYLFFPPLTKDEVEDVLKKG